MKKHIQTYWATIVLLILLFVMWLTTINIPYWWDSAGLVIEGAHVQLKDHFWPIYVGLDGAYAHPTFFIVFLALSWKIFGESLLVSHVVHLIFAVILMLYLPLVGYELTKKRFSGNLIGLATGATLLFTPLFYAQLGIVYLEIPMTAFAVMTFYYFLKNNYKGYLIASILMLMMKEIGFLVNMVLIGVTVLQDKKLILPLIKKMFFLSLPLVSVIIWLLYHKAMTGWWYVPPTVGKREFHPAFVVQQLIFILQFFFVDQWRGILTFSWLVIAEEMLIKPHVRKLILRWETLMMLLIPLACIMLFGLTDFLHRYLILALPFFYLLTFYGWWTLIDKTSSRKQFLILGLGMIILCWVFSTAWRTDRVIKNWYFSPLEENLEYLDVIDVGQASAKFIEKNFAGKIIYTTFPNDYMLSKPYMHYVSKPVQVVNCNKYKPGDTVDLVLFHLYTPPQGNCLQIIKNLGLHETYSFDEKGKFVKIFEP